MGAKTGPYLYTRRPSPTTTEYTVSTLPPLTTPLRLLLALAQAIQLVLAAGLALLGYALLVQSPYYYYYYYYHHHHQADHHPAALLSEDRGNASASFKSPPLLAATRRLVMQCLAMLRTTPMFALATRLADAVPSYVLLPLGLGLGYLVVLRRLHTTESLLVLRGLGIQTRSAGRVGWWWWFFSREAGERNQIRSRGGTTRFIPTEKIQDVLINEAFRGFEVRYYLVVVVEGEEDLVVVFPELLPRRQVVEEVWRGVRGCIFEEPRGVTGGTGYGNGPVKDRKGGI